MIHLLQLIMDNSNKPELFEVLQQVIDLDEDEKPAQIAFGI